MRVEDIKYIEVDWMEQYRNDPALKFVLKQERKVAAPSDFRYRTGLPAPVIKTLEAFRLPVTPAKNLFWAVHENEVQFYMHDRNDHSGFGSRQFQLHMANDWEASDWKNCRGERYDPTSGFNVPCCFLEGRILTLKGPWSSGASGVSKFIGLIVSVATLEGEYRDTIRAPVHYHKNKRKWPTTMSRSSGVAYSCHYTLAFVQEAIDKLAPHLELYEGDYGWYPVRKGDAPKNPRKGNRRVSSSMLSDEQCMVVEA